jgi:hypothetical protein
MVRRLFTLGTRVAGLALIAVLVMGLAGVASAFAAVDRTPVVTKVSPNYGWNAGGNTVTITGKHFKRDGKNLVKKVTFDRTSATRVRVKSATKLTVTVPAGKGRVNVRVTTKWGTSARVAADKYTYKVPAATQMALNAGDGQTASLGAAVSIAPSVIVKDVKNDPVAGVTVTFAVASGDGSVTGASAVSNASGIATVGSWKLGTVAGANTLTATCAGLAGSPVTFTATGDPGILIVQQAGAPVRAYSLAEVQALTPFAGFAGINKATVLGPDAVTGAKVTDIVADALGAALAVTQSVEITNYVAPPGSPYFRTYTRDQLVNLAGSTTFTYADAGTKVPMTPTGTLAAILIYSDPDARVMPPANGPLRFVIADSLSENMVYGPSSSSISTVNVLNVITTP